MQFEGCQSLRTILKFEAPASLLQLVILVDY
uniref:Uncharacterized protein n=1 Tax=Siphoviridae sp. ctWsj12 TaxID=2826363 RepID=A0A8S5NS64_9CAUD|nr:MAG TPA: hypothetical protein [Siphoviridae sp. ctWsj12]